MGIETLLLIASLMRSTTYGYGEFMCGDIGKPVPCAKGAITASGIEFDPSLPMAAIAAPTKFVLRAKVIGLRVEGGKCKRIHLVDKMNPRYIGVRGFDLSPAAVKLLTGDAHPKWSGRVEVCQLTAKKVK